MRRRRPLPRQRRPERPSADHPPPGFASVRDGRGMLRLIPTWKLAEMRREGDLGEFVVVNEGRP
jgi:hypothetical protein